MHRHTYFDVVVIFLASLATSAPFLLDAANRNPAYFRDYRLNDSPDARHYVKLGRNFLVKGVYSRQSAEPYQSDMLRTPVYPLTAGTLDILCGTWSIYVFQCLCRFATAAVIYAFCVSCFGRFVGLTASALYALDSTSTIIAMEAMSESLFIALVTPAIFLWLWCLSKPRTGRGLVLGSIAVGLLVGLATLTRPTSLYLPVVLAVSGVARARPGARWPMLRGILLMLAASTAVVLPWIARNAVLFGVPRLTSVEAVNMVYFMGGGAYAIEFGIPLEEAQQRIAKEYDLAPQSEGSNPWTTDRGIRLMDEQYREAAAKILAEYPTSFMKATLIGLTKSTISHNVAGYASISLRTWAGGGLDRLLKFRVSELTQTLASNDPLLLGLLVWQLLYNGLIVLFSLLGVVVGLRSAELRPTVLYFLLIAFYHAATVAAVGLDSYSRQRVPIVPIQCVLAAFAIAHWWRRSTVEDSSQAPTLAEPAG